MTELMSDHCAFQELLHQNQIIDKKQFFIAWFHYTKNKGYNHISNIHINENALLYNIDKSKNAPNPNITFHTNILNLTDLNVNNLCH